jgi:hypothetical protein
VYIGRPSKWGNPFEIGKDGDREAVIQKYRKWVVTQPDLMAALPELRGKVLGCWCAPKACHGDVLASLANHQHDVTDEIVGSVENEVGMGCGAWDMVSPKEIIASAWKFLPNAGVIAREQLTAVTEQRDEAREALAELRASVLDLSHPNIKMILSERDEARELIDDIWITATSDHRFIMPPSKKHIPQHIEGIIKAYDRAHDDWTPKEIKNLMRERDEAREERDKTIAMLWRLNVAATNCYNGAFDYSDLSPREENVLPIINEVEEFLANVKLTHQHNQQLCTTH